MFPSVFKPGAEVRKRREIPPFPLSMCTPDLFLDRLQHVLFASGGQRDTGNPGSALWGPKGTPPRVVELSPSRVSYEMWGVFITRVERATGRSHTVTSRYKTNKEDSSTKSTLVLSGPAVCSSPESTPGPYPRPGPGPYKTL